MEQTLAIIKPDAVAKGFSGKIIDLIEENGFKIVRMKKLTLTTDVASEFYQVHSDKPFFNSLVEFMSSGPCIIMVLEKDDAIRSWRQLMGATNPKDAVSGSIRSLYGSSVENNAVHGSDGLQTAQSEVSYFFNKAELCC